jgi:hypothetical protein
MKCTIYSTAPSPRMAVWTGGSRSSRSPSTPLLPGRSGTASARVTRSRTFDSRWTPTRERMTMDFVGQDKQSVFEPLSVVLRRRDCTLIDARDDPERSV